MPNYSITIAEIALFHKYQRSNKHNAIVTAAFGRSVSAWTSSWWLHKMMINPQTILSCKSNIMVIDGILNGLFHMVEVHRRECLLILLTHG